MRKLIRVTLSCVLICLLFSAPIFSQINTNQNGSQQDYNNQVYKFRKVLDLIANFYVDTVNSQKIVEDAITEMLSDLDPHSVYISMA
ncbi:MAG: hypothetical protein NTW49_04890 [Bacteroidia bacterium]|nr:hypothetical protein [Bacteroidia bacterium]